MNRLSSSFGDLSYSLPSGLFQFFGPVIYRTDSLAEAKLFAVGS
jgi:hypothetical protein